MGKPADRTMNFDQLWESFQGDTGATLNLSAESERLARACFLAGLTAMLGAASDAVRHDCQLRGAEFPARAWFLERGGDVLAWTQDMLAEAIAVEVGKALPPAARRG